MFSKQLERRDFLRLSAAVAGASVLAACAPSAEPTQAPAEGPAEEQPEEAQPAAAEAIKLNYWINWGADSEEVFEQIQDLDVFKDTFGDSTLEVTPSKDMESLLTAVASGSGPDGASNLPYPELYARDALIPITEWVNSSSVLDKEDFLEANWTGAEYKGEIWGVPCMECFVRYALCIDLMRWEEAGLDPDNLPRTWSEVFEAHKQITTFDDAGNLDIMGLDPYERMGGSIGNGNPWMIPHSWGFEYWDAENEQIIIDTPEMVEAWETLTQFYEHMGPEKVAGFRDSFGNWGQGFNQGRTAMTIDGYWAAPGAQRNNPERPKAFTWMPVPDGREGTPRVQVAGGHYIVIPTIAKNPEEMYQFAELCTLPEAADVMYEGLGFLPARKSYLEGKDVSKYPGLDWFIESALDNDVLGAIATNPITGVTANQWYALREEVYFGDMTAQEAVTQMQEECDKALDNMLDRA